jgi:hypothetical protein
MTGVAAACSVLELSYRGAAFCSDAASTNGERCRADGERALDPPSRVRPVGPFVE